MGVPLLELGYFILSPGNAAEITPMEPVWSELVTVAPPDA
jgi:hypothetical protein